MDLLDRVRGTGLLPAGAPVVVLLSGGRDSVCLLGLRGADRARRVGRCTSTTACAPARQPTRRHCRCAVRAARRRAAGRARDAGRRAAVRATSRRGRATSATAPGRGWPRATARRLAAGHTATDQAETILYRLASSPSRRALLGMTARDGRLVRPLLGVTREETAAHCRVARARLGARTPPTARTSTRAGACATVCCRRWRRSIPRAERNVVRAAELLREEAAVLDEIVDVALAGRDHIGLEHLACAAAGAGAAGPASPGRGRHRRPLPAGGGPLRGRARAGDGALDSATAREPSS